jgi:hypothetical protein
MIIASKRCACNKSWLKSNFNTLQNPVAFYRSSALIAHHTNMFGHCIRLETATARPIEDKFFMESVYPERVDAFFSSNEKQPPVLIACLASDNYTMISAKESPSRLGNFK